MGTSESIMSFLNRNGGTFSVRGANEDPVLSLAMKINKQPNEVRSAVGKLQDGNRVWVRRGNNTAGEKPAIGICGRRRTRPETAEGKRQARYAGNIPANLPDSMCTPVETRFVAPTIRPAVSPEEVKEDSPVPSAAPVLVLRGYLPEILTRVLKELQVRATECGEGCGHKLDGKHGVLRGVNSCTDLISEILPEATLRQRQRLNSLLADIGLRASVTQGQGRHAHYVRLDVGEVTAEMIRRSATSTDKKSEEGGDDDLVALLDHLDGLETTVNELRTKLSSTESNLTRATAQLGERNQTITEKNSEIATKDAEIVALQAEVTALQADVQVVQRFRETVSRVRGGSKS